jgi:hypothetical protein
MANKKEITKTQWNKAKSSFEGIDSEKWGQVQRKLDQALDVYKLDLSAKKKAPSGKKMAADVDKLKAALDDVLKLEQKVWLKFNAQDTTDLKGRGWSVDRLTEFATEVGLMSYACEAVAESIRKNRRPKSYAKRRLITTVAETLRDFSADGSIPLKKDLQALSKILLKFMDENPSPDICKQVTAKLRREITP